MAQLISGTTIAGHTAIHAGNLSAHSIATTTYVTTQINNLINGAPGALDTLDELAAALGDDASFATTITNSIASKLALSGGNMTGNINWSTTGLGLTWGMNTDGAYIKFFNTGDGDTDSRLEYATSDNGDEYHRWVIAGTEKMTLKWAGLTINGTVTATGGNSSNWNTAYGWGNHASVGYLTSYVETIGTNNTSGVAGAKYQINDTWLRVNSDNRQFQTYGNSRSIIYRTDGVTNDHGGGAYPHIFYYGGSSDSNRVVIFGTNGDIWMNYAGDWISSLLAAKQNTSTAITTSNIGSQSVSYASSAGNADTVDSLHASAFVRAYTTTNDNIDSDWGQSFKTFDPVPSGTPPISSPNLRTINIGENFSRRTQLAFNYATDQAWFRRNQDGTWYSWREFIHSGNIGSQSVSYATTAGALTSMNISQFTNNSGYLTGITSSQIITALGYTPASSSSGLSQATADSLYVAKAGGSTVAGITYFSNGESMQLYGIRGRYSGDGIHLYGKVDIGHPGGWGAGIGYAPSFGLSTYGGALFAYNQGTVSIGASGTAKLHVIGNTAGQEVFAVDGTYGRLFSVVDDLTDSLYSVNTIAGLPVLEVFANNIVKIGKFGTNAIYVGQDGRVGFGTTDFSYTASDNSGATGTPTNNRLFVNGSIQLLSNSDGIVFGRGTSTYLKDEDLSFGWGGGWYMTDGTYLRVRGNKMVYSGGSARFDDSLYLGGETYRLYSANSGLWTNGNLGAGGDLYLGTRGTWLSSWLNQGVRTDSAPTFADVYVSSWFRNNANNTGIYNQTNGNHFYSRSGTAWGITGNGGSVVHLQFRINHESTLRGSVYGDGSGFGLLDSGDNWRVRVDTSGAQVYGSLTVGNSTSSDIYMTDSDENTRRIHTNSGRIGFLNTSSSWGAYCDNGGHWVTDFNMYASSGYFYGSGSIRLGDMWGGAGLYRPSGSMVFGIENSDWIFSKGAVTQAYFAGGDGNLWMRWAGDWLSNLLGAKQNASTAITTSNIGSQSVNYASSAGSVAWTNVSSRPTALSQFSNDLGNYGGWITSSGSISGNAATATRTSGNSGYGHPGTGMWPFYNWGGSNGGGSAPSGSSYTTGIAVGSNPGDQAYGFQIANNMWNTGLWTRNYNSGFGDWIRLLDASNHPYAAGMNQYVNTGSDPTFNSIYLANGNLRLYQGDGTALRVVTAYGWMNLGAQNGSWTHMYASQDFYFNRNLYVNGTQVVTNSGTWSINVSGSASSATSASYAGYLPTLYAGGQQTNPQVYFNDGIGLRVAMTGAWSVWSDTLWVNGYSGSDVRWMCALHFLRNSEPRMAISAQTSNSGSYGSYYEVITAYNIGSQSVSYASTAGNANSISSAVGGSYTWTSTNYFRSTGGGYLGSLASPPLQAYSGGNESAYMSFHKGGHYAVNMGLDADNVFRIGGWSASSNRLQMDMSGNLTMAGDITAYSDARVKENVKTIENALDKTLALRGVSYNRIDSEDTKTKIGVIAQETLEVVPEVVNQDNAGMYNVSYGNMAALFIEAIKEQQAQIEELKLEIKKLRGE